MLSAVKNYNRMEQTEERSRDRSTILVPIDNIELFETLLPPAIRAAEKRNSLIILFHAVRVASKVRASRAEEIAAEKMHMLSEGKEMLKEAGRKCEIMVQITHSLTSAIKEIVESREVDLIIMGSRNKSAFMFNSMVYHKLLKLNCPIMLSKDNVKAEFKNVIVLDEMLQNVTSMLEHAAFLLGSTKPKIFVIQTSNEQEKIDELKNEITKFEKKQHDFKAQIFIEPNVVKGDIMKIMVTDDKKDTCFFYSYSEMKWLKHLFHTGDLIKTDHPVFLFKP